MGTGGAHRHDNHNTDMEGVMAAGLLALRGYSAAIVIALISVVFATADGAAQSAPTAQVVAVIGEAAVARGKGPGRPLAANASVSAGDTVKTGAGSKCEL